MVLSLSAHIHEIDTFVTEAMKILTVIPQSVEEIGDTNIQYSNLQDRRPQVRFQSNYCHPYFIEMCKLGILRDYLDLCNLNTVKRSV